MEVTIYDNLNRRVVLSITVALALGWFAAFSAFFLVRGGGPELAPQAYLLLFAVAGMILALFAVIRMMTSARIRVERASGEVSRFYLVFGREMRRQRFHLSDFDRISLSRGFRAGYQVSVVGPGHELTVLLTPDLGTARDRANKVTAECGLKVSDQL